MSKKKFKSQKSSKRKSKKPYEIFPEVVSRLKKDSRFSLKEIEKLEELFGERVKKALELIANNKVKKFIFQPSNITRWVVQGLERDYLVIEQYFCSCKDFLFNVLLRKEVASCYHLLAREIAEKTEKFTEIIIEDAKYSELMSVWLS